VVLGLAVMLTTVGTGSAFAAQAGQSAPIYGPNIFVSGFSCPGGATPTTNKFGTVVFNLEGQDNALVDVVVHLRGASPNTIYGLALQQDPGGCPVLVQDAVVTTNAQGNADAHYQKPKVPTATHLWEGIAKSGFTEVYGSPAVPAQ
jgi:hypothetical protein